jgi:hypothetical protein
VAATSTWSGSSLASLALSPGTCRRNWGLGAAAVSLVLDIGTSPISEPGAVALMSAGSLAAGVHRGGERGGA